MFINFSEGRILADGANWEYQYHLKDHLGNVRTTFSAKELTVAKTATLETVNATAEQGEFLRFAETHKVQSYLFDHTNGSSPSTTNGYAQRLSGSTNEKFGLAKSISVMPGDVITAEVYAKYIDNTPSNRTAALNALLSQIAAGTAPAGVVIDGGSLGSSTANFPFPIQAGTNTSGSSETGPKAYLNWLVFKRDGTFVTAQSGYDRLSITPKETGQDVAHEKLYSPTITITEPGFVYIYLSNEEAAPLEVYFDDFKVTHVNKTPVMQSDDYYAFGLNFNSYQRENSLKNKMVKFQGQEHIEDLDLGWDSFKWRNHMPDIGRFFNVDPLAEKYLYNSPYAFSENRVINTVELEGLEAVLINPDKKSSSEEQKASDGRIAQGAKDIPNSSKVVTLTAHGDPTQIVDDKSGTRIKTGKQLDAVLTENSPQWKNRESNEGMTVVLYSCRTGSDQKDENGNSTGESVAQKISASKEFKDVEIIAPDQRVYFTEDGVVGTYEAEYANKNDSYKRDENNKVKSREKSDTPGNWVIFKNGKKVGSIEGDQSYPKE